ncbi:sulfite exporter TauE/SafE family protein [Ruegeria marina]|uniref:Probable membrane transporter protein n=1 Tax=Ruegeria marina TaxID=639004 RepID=A0A1G7BJV7_9RHOB|nr:sulfite exporter TauE/SafE family protein [Ruegeria marina]SDE27172.1 hypothetical protein SAMN04488239_116114 [Ruegeria marina]
MEEGLVMAFVAFAAGGLLKGAIGAGTPVVAVPIMSIYYGVPFAVAVFALPAFLSNLWQLWIFRAELPAGRFVATMMVAAATGAALGSLMLASLPSQLLMVVVAGMALAYVAFRLKRPDWHLPWKTAERVVAPVALASGIMQGAAGISAPLSLTFVSALGLTRPAFIATISAFFLSMSVLQLPTLWTLDILTPQRLAISLGACIPLFGAMPVGAWLARFVDRRTFDRVVLFLLVVVALRLLHEAV